MRIEKCHIAQRNTGEIVAARQVGSADDEWYCITASVRWCSILQRQRHLHGLSMLFLLIIPKRYYIALTLSQRIKRPPI